MELKKFLISTHVYMNFILCCDMNDLLKFVQTF